MKRNIVFSKVTLALLTGILFFPWAVFSQSKPFAIIFRSTDPKYFNNPRLDPDLRLSANWFERHLRRSGYDVLVYDQPEITAEGIAELVNGKQSQLGGLFFFGHGNRERFYISKKTGLDGKDLAKIVEDGLHSTNVRHELNVGFISCMNGACPSGVISWNPRPVMLNTSYDEPGDPRNFQEQFSNEMHKALKGKRGDFSLNTLAFGQVIGFGSVRNSRLSQLLVKSRLTSLVPANSMVGGFLPTIAGFGLSTFVIFKTGLIPYVFKHFELEGTDVSTWALGIGLTTLPAAVGLATVIAKRGRVRLIQRSESLQIESHHPTMRSVLLPLVQGRPLQCSAVIKRISRTEYRPK